MTQPKSVSLSLTKLLESPIVKMILDRSHDIEQVVEIVSGWWGYDLMSRKPSSAYDEYGIFKGTDLDLACFMYALKGRGAVINLPEYESHTKAKIKENQQLTSKYNRHGKLINVGAHKDFFSFNISIIDENVVGEDKVGDFRTFSLTDKLGNWYDGWKRIEFVPTIKENRFLTENKLWTGNSVVFRNFVHPNRWTSVFGQHYIITKLLLDRLDDECKFLATEYKRVLEAGICFPENEGPTAGAYEYGESVQKKFPAFEMKVFIPEAKFQGDYQFIDETQEAMVATYNKRKRLLYGAMPALRFMTRASEFAHFKAPDRFPAWMKNVKWEDGFKIPPRGRTQYQRLKLFQDKVGEHSISLLKRTYEKSATVAA